MAIETFPSPTDKPFAGRQQQSDTALLYDAVPAAERNVLNSRFFSWIWHIKGSLALAPGQSSDEAFARLDPLFRESGTSHRRTDDTLIFRKKDQAAQDKMSVFDGGVLRIEKSPSGLVLRYQLTSRALLLCFLAPLLFLAFAQLTIAVSKLEGPSAEEADVSEKNKDVELQLHPIDKALGAPAPEKPKKDDAETSESGAGKHSPTPAYVFAGLFALLYVVGRVLEARLVRTLFRRRLSGS
ncbi:hypothetical protein [Novosphingobium sp. M1R2S20]|uniref:Uncharacterized protein n=1 Tax=Novosphingobium rhizovicinum TaxID=3228928 RepID=A0ABV3RHC4_9SPHN